MTSLCICQQSVAWNRTTTLRFRRNVLRLETSWVSYRGTMKRVNTYILILNKHAVSSVQVYALLSNRLIVHETRRHNSYAFLIPFREIDQRSIYILFPLLNYGQSLCLSLFCT